jgi:hypothetical protein
MGVEPRFSRAEKIATFSFDACRDACDQNKTDSYWLIKAQESNVPIFSQQGETRYDHLSLH